MISASSFKKYVGSINSLVIITDSMLKAMILIELYLATIFAALRKLVHLFTKKK
jgi:hypothetical protein